MSFWTVTVLFVLSFLNNVSSLTINMDETSPSRAIVMVLRKSQPSMILFPNDEEIVINTPGRHFWKVNMKKGQ